MKRKGRVQDKKNIENAINQLESGYAAAAELLQHTDENLEVLFLNYRL